MTTTQQLIETGARTNSPSYAPAPVVLERGEGVRVWDTEGRCYLDFLAGIAVNCLGYGHPELVGAIQAQAAYYPAVTQLVDWDRFLAYWAASVVLYDWDNYIGFQNNFRIYREPKTSLWTIIPWGVDQTWGAGTNWFGRGNGGGFGGGPRDPSAFDTRADLARLCLEATDEDEEGSTCRERYAAALWKAVRQFEEIDWHSVIDTWVERLEPVMQQDGDRRSYSIEQWRRNIDDLRRYADERPSQLRTQLTAAGYEEP